MIKLNFVTPVNKIFPSPSSNSIFLIFNDSGDLSLYRKTVHVWSAGRFKQILSVEWSPDGKFFAVTGDKKYFIYSAEDGKRVNTMKLDSTEDKSTEKSSCKWIKIDQGPLMLAVVDFKTFSIKWNVNCEFELKGGRLLLNSSEEICNFSVDPKTNDLLIFQPKAATETQTKTKTKFKFPFNPQQDTSVLQMSQLSKHLQKVLRVVDDLKGQILKLLKLDDSVFIRIAEIDLELMRNHLLFGTGDTINTATGDTNNNSPYPGLNETEVLEWKSKLKKQHAELLVSIEEVSSVLKSFQSNFPNFQSSLVDKFLFTDLLDFDFKSRNLQHDLAEFLVWLESLVIPDLSSGNTFKAIKSFYPDSRALSLVKNLQLSEAVRTERQNIWCSPFDNLKLQIEDEFKNLLSKINSLDLSPFEIDENCIDNPTGMFTDIKTNQSFTLNGDTRKTLLIST